MLQHVSISGLVISHVRIRCIKFREQYIDTLCFSLVFLFDYTSIEDNVTIGAIAAHSVNNYTIDLYNHRQLSVCVCACVVHIMCVESNITVRDKLNLINYG